MKISIVDDDDVLRAVLLQHLNVDGRVIWEYNSGEQLLNEIEQTPADLILLDVEMPGVNGIDTCRKIRSLNLDQPHIVFVSSHEELELRLAAYDAGANDYIIKPVDATELQRKVRIAELATQQHRSLTEQAQYAGETAFTALSTIGEMGITQQFMHAALTVHTISELAKKLHLSLKQYGLTALIKLKLGTTALMSSTYGECTPFETSLLTRAEKMGRLFQVSDRLAINFPGLTMLLHPMPLNEPERMGRLRDHLVTMAEGAYIRLMALDGEQKRAAQRKNINQVLNHIAESLTEILQNHKQNRIHANEISSQLLCEQISLGEILQNHKQNQNQPQESLQLYEQISLVDHQIGTTGSEKKLIQLAIRVHQELSATRDIDAAIEEQLRLIASQIGKLANIEEP